MATVSAGTYGRLLNGGRVDLVNSPSLGTSGGFAQPRGFVGMRGYAQRGGGQAGYEAAAARNAATQQDVLQNLRADRQADDELARKVALLREQGRLDEAQQLIKGEIDRTIQGDQLSARSQEAAGDRALSAWSQLAGQQHEIDRDQLRNQHYRERDEQQFALNKQASLFQYQLEGIRSAEGKIAELRGTLAKQDMTPEGRKIWAKLNTELTGIQKMKEFALNRNPGEYERLLGDWMTKVEDSGLQHHVQPKPTLEDALKGRFKVMENGWGAWMQPDGKIEMRDFNPRPAAGGTAGRASADKPIDRNSQWEKAVKSVQAYKSAQGLGDAYTDDEVYEEMARMDEREASYSEYLKQRSDPIQRATMSANKTIERFGAMVLQELPNILAAKDAAKPGTSHITAQNMSPLEAATYAMYYAKHLVTPEVWDAFEVLKEAKNQPRGESSPAVPQGAPPAQMQRQPIGAQMGMPAGPPGMPPQVMPDVMMQPPLRPGQMPGPQPGPQPGPMPTPVQRGPMPGTPQAGGPMPGGPGQAPQQALQRMAGQQVPAIPPQGPQGPVQRPQPGMSPAMGGQVQQPERPPITLENLQRASMAANGQPPGVTPPARPPQGSAESQAIRPVNLGTTAERRKLLEAQARELQKLAAKNGGKVPAAKALVLQALKAAFGRLEQDEAREKQQQQPPRAPAESTPGPFWR